MNPSNEHHADNQVGRRRLLWLVPIVVVCFGGVFATIFYISAIRIPMQVPVDRVIGAFDGQQGLLKFRVQDNAPYQILFAMGRGQSLPPDWSGKVAVSANGVPEITYQCSTATMIPSNWLREHPDMTAYIVTWQQGASFSESLKLDTTYTAQLRGNSRFAGPVVVYLSGMSSSHPRTSDNHLQQ